MGRAAADDTVEAIVSSGAQFVLGVMWHPEEDLCDRIIPTLVSSASR